MARAAFAGQFDALHDAASQSAGHNDFGDRAYETGMRVLLDALDSGPPLSDEAYTTAQAMVVEALVGRLFTQAKWNAWPDVLGARIRRPLVVVGVPRTGTTALHKVLSLDPQFQGLERWLAYAPMPRPPRETWESEPTYQAAVQRIEAFRQAQPASAAAHSSEAWEVDECILPMAHSFCCNWFGSKLDVPDYDAWFLREDQTYALRRHADVLKLIGKDDARPWLLKNPTHLMSIDALLSVFPDACIVQTHRHPVASIASLSHMLGGIRDQVAGRQTDRGRLQAREIALWSEATRRGMAAQDRHPERFFNVWHRDFRADPMATVAGIYNHFGLELSAEAEARMQDWARANPPNARLGYDYPPAQDPAAIQDAFAPYIARYGLD
jgi:hypothetical protein